MKNGCCGQPIGVRAKLVGACPVIFRRFGLGAFVVLFTAGLLHAQFSDPVGIPQRGVTPAGFYSISDIETIDAVHGNLFLKIPITSFPAGRTGSTASLELAYNSSNDAWSGTELVNSNFIDPYDSGGWHYNINYSFTNDYQSQVDQTNCSSTTNYDYYRYRLVTPDGSSHILFIRNKDTDVLNGYYRYQRINCAPAYENGTVSFYTADGTYLRMTLTVNSISPDGSGGYRLRGSWTLYLPDGHIVTGQDESTTRIVDRNGNGFSISRDNPAPGAYTTTLTDDLGRTITLQQTASGPDIITQQVTDTSSGSNVVQPLTWTVNWGPVSLDPQTHHYQCYHPPDPPSTCYAPYELVVTSLVLPSQLNPQNPQNPPGYTFTYCTEIGQGCPVLQWGQLNGITLPTGAQVQYTYDSQPTGPVHGVAPFRIVSKTLTWQDPLDSTQHTETTSYSFASTQSIFTNPDGGTETHLFYDVSDPNPDWHNGLVYSVTEPSGDLVEHVWSTNVPKGGNPASAPPYHLPGNPIVLQELTTKAGGSLTSARVLAYDRNGNRTEIDEFDFTNSPGTVFHSGSVPTGFSGGVFVRASVNTYLNGADPAIPASSGATAEDSRAYWNDHTPQLLNLVANTAVSGIGPGSVTSFVYDNGTLSRGNVTQENRWDSAPNTPTNPYETVVNTYDGYTTAQGDFSALCANAGSIGAFGNLAVRRNAAGHSTVFCYDAGGARLTRRVEAADNTTDARTFDYIYDGSDGSPLTEHVVSITDVDHGVTRTFRWDVFGRVVRESEGNVRTTQTEYDDVGRKITVRSDRDANGDGLLVELTRFDPLGRVHLSQDWAGNYVRRRYIVPAQTGFSYELVSNPFASGQETTMGWTRTKRDVQGRVVEVKHFSGSGLPVPWSASDPPSSGAATTTYNANVVTVSDEAQVSRTNRLDGLGRLYQVTENGISATTTYQYDALDNLISVTQPEVNVRTFAYSSLSRLLSANNPETGPISYTYYPGGNLYTKRDSRNSPVTVMYEYNALDQIKDQQYSDSTPAVYNTYDKSWLKQVKAVPWSYNYTAFDGIGRVKDASQSLDNGPSYAFQVTYKPVIGVDTITYPNSGRMVRTTYDAQGRPYGLTGQASSNLQTKYVISTTYQADGAIQTQTLGNNVVVSRSDNARLQPQTIQAGNLLTMTYGYSPTENNGNVISQTISRSGIGTWTQNYDYIEPPNCPPGLTNARNNRLSSVAESGTWSRTYCYDNRGNQWVNSNAGVPLSPFTPTSPSNFDASNHLNIQNSGYDGGNQTGIGGFQFQYDAENRLIASTFNQTTTQYSYDGLGRRVTKTVGGQTTTYVFDPFGNLAQEYNGAWASTTGTKYVIADALGSTRLVADSSGAALRCYDYVPFGEELAAGTAGRTAPCFGNATYPASGPDMVNEKFTGKERDQETGLDYFLARYYSGAQGRFTSVDPANIGAALADPQSWNGYAYGRNNPLKYVDPTGLAYRVCQTDESGKEYNCGIVNDQDEGAFLRSLKAGGLTKTASGRILGQNGQIGTAEYFSQAQQERDQQAAQFLTNQTGTVVNGLAYATGGVLLGAGGAAAYTAATAGSVALSLPVTSGGTATAAGYELLKAGYRNMELVDEATAGIGQALIAGGDKIRDVARLVSQYGGQASDWVKLSTSGVDPSKIQGYAQQFGGGSPIQLHYYKNIVTGAIVELKSVFTSIR